MSHNEKEKRRRHVALDHVESKRRCVSKVIT